MIDAVVAAEPTIQPSDSIPLTIIDGGEKVGACNRSLIDYLSLMNVYQVCTDLNSEIGKERIRTLKALGLLNNRSAQEILNDYGLLKAQNEFAPIYDAYQVPLCVSVTYANAYGRFDVAENLCDYSLAALKPSSGPGPIPEEKLRQLYAIGNGIPPSGGVHVINNSRNLYAPISTPDGGAEGALSLRRVVTGGGEGAGSISREQKAREHAWHRRLDAGVRAVRAAGYLHGKEGIIVQGRNDALVAPNHCSRAYYARNQIVENVRSKLRYYEVTNAHHFDAWNSMTNFAPFKPCVPLHLYFIRAMSLIYAQLKRQHEPLPPSQVIYARKSGGDLEVPEISPNPAGYGEIKFASGVLTIPQEPPSLQAERALPAETVGLDLIRKATSHAIAVG